MALQLLLVLTGTEYSETLHLKERQKILHTQLPASSQRTELWSTITW